MDVDFYRHDEGEGAEIFIGRATWKGSGVEVTGAADDGAVLAVRNIFRRTPVVVDDASLRTSSGRGASVVQPGSYEWFRMAAISRAPKAGLSVRFVPDPASGGGWDPAAQYLDFREVVDSQS